MFSENERAIFGPYWNGESQVYADPIRVHRRLYHKLSGDPNRYFQSLHILKDSEGNPLPDSQQIPEEERFQAKEKVLEAAIYALDMVPFDSRTARGATENDVMAALRAYLEFRASKKVNGLSVQPCSPCTPHSAPSSSPPLPKGGSSTGLPPYLRVRGPSPTVPTTDSGSIPQGLGWLKPGK